MFKKHFTRGEFCDLYHEYLNYVGTNEIDFIVSFLQKATALTNEEKMNYIDDCIVADKGYCGWNDSFIELFSNDMILDFYIENYNFRKLYENLSIENLIINRHRENMTNNIYLIFAVTLRPPYKDKYIIPAKKIEQFFSLILNKIKNKIDKERLSCFIYELFNVIYLNMLLRGVRLSRDLQEYNWLVNLLYNYVQQEEKEKIEKILNNKEYEKIFFEKEMQEFIAKTKGTREDIWQFKNLFKQDEKEL